MFWRKKKNILIDDLGEFEMASSTWYCDRNFRDQKLNIGLDGSTEKPDNNAVLNARMLIENIDPYLQKAEDFLKNQDINKFTKNAGKIYLSSLFCKENIGDFDIEFSLTKWEEAYILVHFQDSKPYELSLGD